MEYVNLDIGYIKKGDGSIELLEVSLMPFEKEDNNMILKKVNPDFYWFKCPQCGNTGKIDGEQASGKVSIQCMNKGCTYHETKNWLEDKPYL